jgi:hypothetical protein
MKSRRIFWNPQERAAVSKKAIEILREFPMLPIFRAVGQAQEAVLPAARHRAWLTKATLGPMIDEINAELNKPVASRIRPVAEPEVEKDLVALAVDYANRKESEAIRRATDLGVTPPSFEFLLVLWSSNFRAYVEAKNDKL